MTILLKLFLFCLFIYLMGIAFFRLYKILNEKIISSRTMGGVLGYALLLAFANLFLFMAGLVLFYKLYAFLTF